MTVRIAINGLGRIGRCIARAIGEMKRSDIQLVAMNGPAATETHVHLLSYDSVHGFYSSVTQTGENEIDLGYGPIPVFHERDPKNLPWAKLKVDVVLECTGHFTSKEAALAHIAAGAKNVLISAPANDADKTIVYGVNHSQLTAKDQVISIGSCTTNCLAPIAQLLNDHFGIEKGYMTTIHSYTSDQNLLDNSHKDLRRARAAAMAMVPTSTGVAKALSLVIPELKGKLDGHAMRVPTPNVSCVDLNMLVKKPTSVEAIHEVMNQAAQTHLKNVLAVNHLPLVSIDFNHSIYSSIVDATTTKVIDKNWVHMMAWYDNEWGFANRMLDVAALMR